MTSTNTQTIDIESIRSQFPALAGSTVFLENAGGSQVPRVVADRMQDYMLSTYVQLGAPYELSATCTRIVDEAHDFANTLMNGGGVGQAILGASSTHLCNMLADCYADVLEPGDEIVISEAGHETNIGCWVRLAERWPDITIRWWRIDDEMHTCPLESLDEVLSERTRIVALPHVSNLLGEIVDLKPIVDRAHSVGARVVADGVAYAPHRAIDVKAWDVDWYVFSAYKVYGPHIGVLFGKDEAIAELTGPNHFFISKDSIPAKLEPGGVSHEACAGLLGVREYLRFLASAGESSRDAVRADRNAIVAAFDVMARCEQPLIEQIMTFLNDTPGVRIIGPGHVNTSRVGTISFVHDSHRASTIAQTVCERDIGIRNGHMYAYRLCEALKIDPVEGVVRVSLVHYNSGQDIERVISDLNDAFR